jgi:osmotically-inducible protein OsmY
VIYTLFLWIPFVLLFTGLPEAFAVSSNDSQLSALVQQRFASDAKIQGDRILVQAESGHVVLEGMVDTPQMKEAATGAALSVSGVQSIENHLSVRGEIPSDAKLQADVTNTIHTSALTAHSTIVAHVTKGDVTLEGAVPDARAWREATRLAETVPGVRTIRNRLTVTGSPPSLEATVVP